jgi:hypothetical protein
LAIGPSVPGSSLPSAPPFLPLQAGQKRSDHTDPKSDEQRTQLRQRFDGGWLLALGLWLR